jgi:hypothetical protein
LRVDQAFSTLEIILNSEVNGLHGFFVDALEEHGDNEFGTYATVS